MKIFILLITLALTFNASAGLITTETVEDDKLLVEFHLNNANPDLYEFLADFMFDSSALAIDELFGENGFEANIDFYEMYVNGSVFDYDIALFNITTYFEENAFEVLGTNIFLGTAQFDIIGDIGNVNFSLDYVEAYDIDYNTVSPSTVPEPSALALFALALFGLTRYRKS